MDKIEIGEYVRTNDGRIDKVIALLEDSIGLEKHKWCNGNYIVKHSKNIIELIEVGDYVNGLEVYKGRVANGKEKLLVRNYLIHGMALEVVDIKSILTKEQMEANQYVVE